MAAMRELIEAAWEQPDAVDTDEVRRGIEMVIDGLDDGSLRVAEKIDGCWTAHDWIKKAVLLSFRFERNRVVDAGHTRFFDKLALKYADYTAADFERDGVRVVPDAIVRRGAYVAPGVILMPSYVNVGARIGAGTLVDTWATIGSCAQIGCNVHIAGGTGIGGVLEPVQATPTIVEDDCFIGARSEIVEGVVVEQGAVVSMGVYIGQSTRILDRRSGEISYGRVPAGAVVVPGSMPTGDGSHSLYCAVIVKTVDAKTRAKTGINELLRRATSED